MELQVGEALRKGYDTVVARSGVMLVLVFAVVNLIFLAGPASILGPVQNPTNAFALGIGGLIGVIISTVVLVVAIRTITAEEREMIPEAFYRRQLGTATINLLLGEIVAAVIIGLGFVLIIPGLYLLVSLLFWQIFVAVENEDFIDAFRSSWALSADNRWSILFLVVGVLVVLIGIQAVNLLLSAVVSPAAPLINAVFTSVGTVYAVGAVVAAYNQLQA